MPCPLPSSFSDLSQLQSAFFWSVLLEPNQTFPYRETQKLCTLVLKLFKLTQTYLKCQQYLQSYQEESWGWGQHRAMHVSLPLQNEGAPFASQHWVESTLILLYQVPISN